MDVVVGRIYDPPAVHPRVLVDRVWPRGVRKDQAPWDRWLPQVAPSTELRRWYRHDPERWPEFQRRYREELEGDPERAAAVEELLALARQHGQLCLLTATRDVERSQAAVLQAVLSERLGGAGG